MDLIQPTDPQYFEQSSTKPYDRHKYKLTFPEGHSMILESYEQVQVMWFEHLRNWKGVKIEVIDRSKGFA